MFTPYSSSVVFLRVKTLEGSVDAILMTLFVDKTFMVIIFECGVIARLTTNVLVLCLLRTRNDEKCAADVFAKLSVSPTVLLAQD